VNETVTAGHDRQLDESDLWKVAPDDQPEVLNEKFDAIWAEELKKPNPSLISAVRRLVYWRVVLALVFRVLLVAASFAGPILLQYILDWLVNPNAAQSEGITYALILFGFALFTGIITSHNQRTFIRGWLQVKTAIITAIFRKSMRISVSSSGSGSGEDGKAKEGEKGSDPAASSSISSGQIVNLMSNDADQLGMAIFNSFDAFLSPLQLIIALVLIYQKLGVGMGLCV
jgi:ABC-type multidrug transport system fused ATPase/permease subunit